MIIKKFLVIIVALVLIIVAVSGILFFGAYATHFTSKSSPHGGSSSNVPAGRLDITVDKTINDNAYAEYMAKMYSSEGTPLNESGINLNSTKMLYNLTITYKGVGTAFFAWPDIQVHTTEGNASYNILNLPTTKIFGDGNYVYLNNSQSMSGQVAACYNDSAEVTSISVTAGVLLNNLADASRYSASLYDKTDNIPGVSSSLSVISQYSGVAYYYPNVTLDWHQIDCEITGWTPAYSSVAAEPESINDSYRDGNATAFIYTNQVISETLKIKDTSSDHYFTLSSVTGNIVVNAYDLPLTTNNNNNGYFYLTVYITGPKQPFVGPVVIALTGSTGTIS